VVTVPDQPAPTAVPLQASAVAAAIVLILSLTTVVVASSNVRPGGDYQQHTLLLGSDLALLVLALISVGGLRSALTAWRRHACVLAAGVLGVALVPSFLLNPSDRGVAALARWAGALALGLTIVAVRRDGRRLVLGAMAVVGLAHLAVAAAERAAGGPIGLGALGEPSAYEIGGRFASSGLTVHPYVLAAWCAVTGTALLALGFQGTTSSRLGRVAGVAAFAGIGLTMSRAGAIGGALGLSGLAVAAWRARAAPKSGHNEVRSRPDVTTILAAGGAFCLGVLVDLSGWVSRAGQATGSVDALSSGRGALLRQAWSLMSDNLLAGVGPGRYVIALSERPEVVALSPQSPRPVHLTPLLVVVEGGLLVVPALVLVALAIVRACLRSGVPAVAVTLAMLPFLALDHLAWSYPQGLVLTGLWLGVLDLLAQDREADDPDPADGPAPVHATVVPS